MEVAPKTRHTKALTQSAAMCCDTKAAVVDSRPNKGGSWRRRRVCQVCGRRWTTIEIAHGAMASDDVEMVRIQLRRMGAEIAGLLAYLEQGRVPHVNGAAATTCADQPAPSGKALAYGSAIG